jgi:hypothetical protein
MLKHLFTHSEYLQYCILRATCGLLMKMSASSLTSAPTLAPSAAVLLRI